MKRVRLIGISALMGAALAGWGLAPAAVADSSCWNGQVCLWTDTNFGGGKYAAQYRNGYVGWMNDQASTFKIGWTTDQRYHYVMFYHDAWFGNPSFYAKEGQAFNLTSLAHPWGGTWNDRISSHDEAY